MANVIKRELFQIYRFRELVVNLVTRDLKVRYRRSWLGFGWSMLHPFLMVVVLYTVFSQIFGRQVDNYGAYVVVGVLVWQLYSQSTSRATRIFIENSGIIKKAYVPLSVFPLALVLSASINFSLALTPALVVLIVANAPITVLLMWLPVCLLVTILFVYGIALILATLSIYFQDVIHIYEVLLLMLMYLSAIFYPLSIIPEELQPLLELNPVFHFISLYRACIYESEIHFYYYLLTTSAIASIFLVIGFIVYTRNKNEIVYHL